ncbi:hypothetical protein I3843_13G093900 [Carya illinoinensis]|uniref:Uncharacterized protein n=1 Tax=Carya illinoinensis TaxID=32201 RepID=A0A8T1NJ78_CARIL|nr:uncharacterized protein LOC122292458 [Carya illinoinensis]KAG6631699.1 hypothetical protein CIPAW_13G108000 [Carya illinoinensis]KAG6681760.1 hypothetical protein I3842_13G107300 [Carya illinoinensis]KAG7950061.1 hypothetical protein I3843_13G093900 [Carya illinoinensis]
MQSMSSLHGCSYGLPLCVSGIAHPLSFSKEMADHDRRREAIKRQRSQSLAEPHANQEMGTQRFIERVLAEIKEGEAGDLAGLLHDLAHIYLACTAKAA